MTEYISFPDRKERIDGRRGAGSMDYEFDDGIFKEDYRTDAVQPLYYRPCYT